jgi:hypothetical protein
MLDLSYPGDRILFKTADGSVLIDPSKDELYINGTKIGSKLEKIYKIDYQNRDKPIKQRLKTIKDGEYFLVVDIGPDGKLFILWFYGRSYLEFRGKPLKEWSYMQGRFYERIGRKHQLIKQFGGSDTDGRGKLQRAESQNKYIDACFRQDNIRDNGEGGDERRSACRTETA